MEKNSKNERAKQRKKERNIPLKALKSRYIKLMAVMFPISFGIDPLRLVDDMLSTIRLFRRPIFSGIIPVNRVKLERDYKTII